MRNNSNASLAFVCSFLPVVSRSVLFYSPSRWLARSLCLSPRLTPPSLSREGCILISAGCMSSQPRCLSPIVGCSAGARCSLVPHACAAAAAAAAAAATTMLFRSHRLRRRIRRESRRVYSRHCTMRSSGPSPGMKHDCLKKCIAQSGGVRGVYPFHCFMCLFDSILFSKHFLEKSQFSKFSILK